MHDFNRLILHFAHIPDILYMQCVTQMKGTRGETNNSFRQKTQRGLGGV